MREGGSHIFLTIKGKMSTFGGKDDQGVKFDEGLALFPENGEKAYQEASKSLHLKGLFTEKGPSNGGAARRLNPDALYIACRWKYEDIRRITGKDAKEYLKMTKVRVTNTTNMKRIEAIPVDWGPHVTTGRVADLSKGAARALGVQTDQEVEVSLMLRKK